MLAVVCNDLLLRDARLYCNAAGAELRIDSYSTPVSSMVCLHDNIEDAPVLVCIQAKRTSNFANSAALATPFLHRWRHQNGKIITTNNLVFRAEGSHTRQSTSRQAIETRTFRGGQRYCGACFLLLGKTGTQVLALHCSSFGFCFNLE